MPNSLIKNIAIDLKDQSAKVLLVENNDKFLFREDVISALSNEGIKISRGTTLKQRVDFELRDNELLLVLLNNNHQKYLEDIINKSLRYEFFLEKYVGSYHIPSVIDEDLQTLDILHKRNPVINLSKHETLAELKKIKALKPANTFNISLFKNTIESELNQPAIDWGKVINTISEGLTATIGSIKYRTVVDVISNVNDAFQKELKNNYPQLKNSSAVKSPKIVSKILDYIDFNFHNDKIALIVVDGLS